MAAAACGPRLLLGQHVGQNPMRRPQASPLLSYRSTINLSSRTLSHLATPTPTTCWPTSTGPAPAIGTSDGPTEAIETPRTPPRLSARIPQPHQLHRQKSARDRRIQTTTTRSTVKSRPSCAPTRCFGPRGGCEVAVLRELNGCGQCGVLDLSVQSFGCLAGCWSRHGRRPMH
jgi:hypothetical protein